MHRAAPFIVSAAALIVAAMSSNLLLHARQTTGPPSTFKVAFLNMKAGKGQQGLAGHACIFQETTNCSDPSQPLNAWGHGVIQDELIRAVGNDPEVIAIGLAEAWDTLCGSGAQVRAVLGWAAKTSTRNGVSLVARYGFAGPERWLQLDTSLNNNPADTAWVVWVPVCLDAACSQSVDIFAAHWYGDGQYSIETYDRQAQQTVDFLAMVPAGIPRVLIGDLNVWEEGGIVCGQPPKPNAMQILRDGGNTDAWPTVHGTAEGYTGMWNRTGCGTPEGYLWKRIDQAWSASAAPIAMMRFGMVTPGDCAPSDHAGIVTRYQLASGTDSTPPTVQITAPPNGAIVSSTTTVAVAAVDDQAVARVGVTIDGAAIGEDASAPYEFPWDTTSTADGSHNIQAWAEDSSGNRALSASVAVIVQNATPNSPPVSAFTAACTNLNCTFTDRSTDSDGGTVAWAWTFGDGGTSTQQSPAHTYATAGTYAVSLTVTDTAGASSTSTQSLTVTTAPQTFDFTLAVSPASKRVTAGGAVSYSVATQVTSGVASVLSLSVTGVPAGASASFTPGTIAGTGLAKLTVSTAADTPGGTFPLTVAATGGGVTRTASVSLIVRRR